MNHETHDNCQALLGNLSDYVDGCLSEELCQEIDRHLNDCQDCRIVVDTLHKTIYLYKKSAEEAEVSGDMRERLFKVLKIEDYLQQEK
jgi:predicted anti-sigma-YlaC factor YlaD